MFPRKFQFQIISRDIADPSTGDSDSSSQPLQAAAVPCAPRREYYTSPH